MAAVTSSNRALVSLSGGMDSACALGLAIREYGSENVGALNVHYGQKHEVELQAAQDVADHYKVPLTTVKLDPSVFQVPASQRNGKVLSSLVDSGAEMPHQTYQEIAEGEGVSPTYVPFRNANLISQATAFAMARDYGWLYVGMHAEDARAWAYPDCTFEFLGAMAAVVWVGTYHEVRLVAPFQFSTKADIARKGIKLGVPFDLTHSCYEGKRPACGLCPTCVERVGAFWLVGEDDPIEYEFNLYAPEHYTRYLVKPEDEYDFMIRRNFGRDVLLRNSVD